MVSIFWSMWAFMIFCPTRGIRRTTAFQAVFYRSLITSRSNFLQQPQQQQYAIFSTTNQDIAERRIQIARSRKQSLQESVQRTTERNLQIKRLLHGQHAPPTEDLYQIKVTVCEELRIALKLSGREKRGRVFLEASNDGTTTLRGLRRELHGFFRALRKDTYILSAGYPLIDEEGRVISDALNTASFWDIKTDEDVVETFHKANQFFTEHPVMKRPAITIHIRRNPDAPLEPPLPKYLENMPDPAASENMTMLSFYSFPIHGIADPEEYAQTLRKLWKPFHALGRVYVAHEGINAQMSVPTNVLERFIECCHNLPEEVGNYLENGINVDPVPLSREEFAVAAVGSDGNPTPPFKNLHIRVRQQIVADGLDKTYDWRQAGYDMPPLEWHQTLKEEKERREKGEAPAITILDCRNDYESDVGIFEGAEPLDTENFRESWDVIKQKLADKPKDTPVMMYCTGGIRCVKAGAYVTQELGFKNVSRLAGGIIAYDRALKERSPEEPSMFKGTNFVFDGRLGRPITEDSLGTCITCGSETSLVSNCRNNNCHKRIIQCENCRTSYHGTCSDACRNRIVNGSMRTQRSYNGVSTINEQTDEAVSKEKRSFSSLDDYSIGHSSPIPSVYPEMEINTRALIPSGSHMVSGTAQGRLLTQLASMTREGRILELGTFTGYATACLLEGAVNAGRIFGCNSIGTIEKGPFVMTMERDPKAFEIAVAQLRIITDQGWGEEAAEELCALREKKNVPVVDETSISLCYDGVASCELMRVSDALASLEEMAAGRHQPAPAPFDMVFLDADKTRLIEYVEALLSSDLVLKKGGIIVVDNVLWKGLVLEASIGNFQSLKEHPDTEESELRRNRRARKLANKMHRFNTEVVKDPRLEVLVLPIRDGLSIIRKK